MKRFESKHFSKLGKERIILLKRNDKRPIEEGWTTNPGYNLNDEIVKNHKGNLGFKLGNGIIVFDCDDPQMERISRMITKKFKDVTERTLRQVSEDFYHYKTCYPQVDFFLKSSGTRVYIYGGHGGCYV